MIGGSYINYSLNDSAVLRMRSRPFFKEKKNQPCDKNYSSRTGTVAERSGKEAHFASENQGIISRGVLFFRRKIELLTESGMQIKRLGLLATIRQNPSLTRPYSVKKRPE